MNLTANFTLEELCNSATAKSHNINNYPDTDAFKSLKYLCTEVLQKVRDYFQEPIVISSGYRCRELNKLVGGSLTSFHLYGCAADIRFNRASQRKLIDLFTYIHDNLPYTELIAEELPDGWIHVALQKGREREHQLKYKFAGSIVKRGSYNEILSKLA